MTKKNIKDSCWQLQDLASRTLPVFGCWVVSGDSLGWTVSTMLDGCTSGSVESLSFVSLVPVSRTILLVSPATSELPGWSSTSVLLGSMTGSLLETGDPKNQVNQTLKTYDTCIKDQHLGLKIPLDTNKTFQISFSTLWIYSFQKQLSGFKPPKILSEDMK